MVLLDLVFVFVFVILVRRSYLISLHHQLFKDISHHGYFQGFTARELCSANKWMGWDGMCGAIIWAPLCGANNIARIVNATAVNLNWWVTMNATILYTSVPTDYGPEWERPPYFSRHRKILILFPPKNSFVILVLVHVPLGHLLPHILWHNPPHFWTFAVPFFRCGSISSIYWLDSTSCKK